MESIAKKDEIARLVRFLEAHTESNRLSEKGEKLDPRDTMA